MTTSIRPFRPDDTLDFERELDVDILATGLRSAYSPPTGIDTAAMDAVVRATAARQLTGRSRRSARFAMHRWVGLAAAIALLVVLAPHRTATSSTLAIDLDRNGEVNILDAFALARSLESGGRTLAAWDVTGDGVVDERDVRAIAERAVRIARPAMEGQVSS